jgi:acylphosphatase
MKEIYCIVYGNVQGVIFRTFAQDYARSLGITGYAKNMDDGTVEVVGQGTQENIEKFLSAISVGPEEAAVDSINIQKGPVEEAYTQFDIL